MAKFEIFFPILLDHEKGWSNHPEDPGGETNMGITMATWQQHAKALLGIEPTSENLKALTTAQAGIIYRAKFWAKVCGDDHTSQDLANQVCDFYCNSGTNAIKVLQRVLNDMGADVQVDGYLGTETMRVLQGFDQAKVYNAFKQGRIAYYKSLNKPTFEAGWINRANSFPDLPEEDV